MPSAVPPGLELLQHLKQVAGEASPAARGLLSMATSGLIGRGWLPSLDALLASTAHTLDIPESSLRDTLPWLQERGLLELSDQRILSVGCLFSTKPTPLTLTLADRHEVYLLGPLAALTAPVALQLTGEIRSHCQIFPQIRLRLACDGEGVHTRDPQTLSLFLPAWQPGEAAPSIMARGVLVRDEEALETWQAQHGDPQGMPVTGLLFAMAASDLGVQLGHAMAGLFTELPDFD